jgi:glutaredoxin 2
MATTAAPTEPLPKLYIYDACPFCVRARMIFGLKGVEHELVFLANHDEHTPIGLVGSKQTPILQLADGMAFPESLDIVRYVDEHFGGPVLLKEASGREDLKAWFASSAASMYPLIIPRAVQAPLAEFALRASREYFTKKKEAMLGTSFKELLAKTPELLPGLNKSLEELESLIHSEKSFNADGVSYDDITLFGTLRGITLVKDVTWPPKVRAYLDHFSQVADVPLLEAMATV